MGGLTSAPQPMQYYVDHFWKRFSISWDYSAARCPLAKVMFTKSDQDVYVSQFEDVLSVLQDVSPWQRWIRANLAIARQHWSADPLQILDEQSFRDAIKHMPNSGGVYGWTDKQTGTIYMKEWGLSSHNSPLLMVLHECVHLVSAPATQGAPYTVARKYLGYGLEEGITEMVAESILSAQGFPPMRLQGMAGHPEFLPIAKDFCKIVGIELLASLLFDGKPDFGAWVNSTYGFDTWHTIMNAASAGDRKGVSKLMSTR